MNKCLIILIGLCLIITKKSSAQTDSKDFNSSIRKGYIIINDSIFKQGFIVLTTDISNAKYVDFLKNLNAKPERLTIKEINEYGYEDVVYIAIPYKNEMVFMRRLNSKEPFVYYYKSKNNKEFYIIKDNNLVLLPSDKKKLRVFLKSELANCDISNKNAQLAIYNKERLAYIFERNSNCDISRIPFFSFGVNFGSTMSYLKLNPKKNIPFIIEGEFGYGAISNENIIFENNFGYFGSIFLDIPLSAKEGKLSFHPEFEFKSVNYNFKVGTISDIGFDINYYSINLFTRYKSLNRKLATFVDLGFIYSILDLRNPNYENSSSSSSYFIYPNFSNSVYGLGIGCGVSLPISARNYIDMSLRYSYLITQERMPSVSSLDLVIGVGF